MLCDSFDVVVRQVQRLKSFGPRKRLVFQGELVVGQVQDEQGFEWRKYIQVQIADLVFPEITVRKKFFDQIGLPTGHRTAIRGSPPYSQKLKTCQVGKQLAWYGGQPVYAQKDSLQSVGRTEQILIEHLDFVLKKRNHQQMA